jgi:hypothetical protein
MKEGCVPLTDGDISSISVMFPLLPGLGGEIREKDVAVLDRQNCGERFCKVATTDRPPIRTLAPNRCNTIRGPFTFATARNVPRISLLCPVHGLTGKTAALIPSKEPVGPVTRCRRK